MCTDDVAKNKNGIRAHYIDVGVQYGASFASSPDVENAHGPGVAVRITRPNGLSVIADFGTQSFDLTSGVAGSSVSPGQVRLRTLLGGVAYTKRVAQLEITPGFAIGYGFGSFELANPRARRVGTRRTFWRRDGRDERIRRGTTRQRVAEPVEPLGGRCHRDLFSQHADRRAHVGRCQSHPGR